MKTMEKNGNKKKQRVAVTWQMCGYIDVDAENLEEAMNMVKNEPDDFSLPIDSDYVDGSFCLSTDSVEEMEVITRVK